MSIITGVSHDYISYLSKVYVSARVLYIVAYLYEPKTTRGYMRTAIFSGVLYSAMSLWLQAAKAVKGA